MYIQYIAKNLGTLGKIIKEGCENESALLILLIIFFKKSQKFFHLRIRIKNSYLRNLKNLRKTFISL